MIVTVRVESEKVPPPHSGANNVGVCCIYYLVEKQLKRGEEVTLTVVVPGT